MASYHRSPTRSRGSVLTISRAADLIHGRTPTHRKPPKAVKVDQQNGSGNEEKVAVAHQTSRTLATNTNGETCCQCMSAAT
jgi:hypothetical protein